MDKDLCTSSKIYFELVLLKPRVADEDEETEHFGDELEADEKLPFNDHIRESL